jgi:hypothetical protein
MAVKQVVLNQYTLGVNLTISKADLSLAQRPFGRVLIIIRLNNINGASDIFIVNLSLLDTYRQSIGLRFAPWDCGIRHTVIKASTVRPVLEATIDRVDS